MLLQFAGWKSAASVLLLPAETTTTAPSDTATSIAAWVDGPQPPTPPSDRLMTSAGAGLFEMPLTVPPDAHPIASAMSDPLPPHLPSTRIGWTAAPNATPATPLALLVTAPTVPATCVPCQLELRSEGWPPHSPARYQSPSSL